MDLYLIRHADAVPEGVAGVADDASRPLTELGRIQARNLGSKLKALGIHFDVIVVSPMLRAQQTLEEMLHDSPGPAPEQETYDGIGFEIRPKKLVRFLDQLARQSVAVIGHEPGLSQFAVWLIGSKKARIDLEKAGIAKIGCEELAKGGGMLAWLATPLWCK
jgi:phosphohistidine phosphatase